MDRGYAKFKLFNQIVAAGSYLRVCRVRDNSRVQSAGRTSAHRRRSRATNVLSDQVVEIGITSKPEVAAQSSDPLDHRSHQPAHQPRQVSRRLTGPGSDGILRLATNLLDVPAEVIALIFLHRWTIETFFRFFKHVLGCRHLLSHSQQGIEIQTYCAIIACRC